MRVLILLDSLWIVALLVFGGLLYHEGARRAALKEDAARIRRELGLIEQALERAVESDPPPPGEGVPFEQLRDYFEGGPSRLREKGLDPFGHAYGPQRPGEPPGVPAASAERLREVAPPEFWAPYPAESP